MALLKFRKGTGSDPNTVYLNEKENKYYEVSIGNKKVYPRAYPILVAENINSTQNLMEDIINLGGVQGDIIIFHIDEFIIRATLETNSSKQSSTVRLEYTTGGIILRTLSVTFGNIDTQGSVDIYYKDISIQNIITENYGEELKGGRILEELYPIAIDKVFLEKK